MADAISHRRKYQENCEKYEQLTAVIEILVIHIKTILAEENNHAKEKFLVSFHDTNKSVSFSSLKEGGSSNIVSSTGKANIEISYH